MNLDGYIKRLKKKSKRNFIIGITGSIGSGKSEVLSILNDNGFYTISSDEKVKKVLTNKKICGKILIRYPEASDRDGLLNKKKLALLVFKDNRAKIFIEGIIHPAVISEILDEIKGKRNHLIAIEIPLLFETGLDRAFNLNITVVANEKIRVKRLIKRGMGLSDIKRRIKNQMADEIKIASSDIVIYNNASKEELKKEVCFLIGSIKKIMR